MSDKNQVTGAIKVVNEVLKMVREKQIQMPAEGTDKEKLEAILDLYAEKLVNSNPQYKAFTNKRDIPEMTVMYLKSMIDREK